jgi:uncharacterized protein (DUF302 family)
MDYYFTTKYSGNFEDAVTKVKALLKNEGFGVLTEIDIKKTLKEKLNVDFKKYMILGACNPPFAHKALLAEDKIGTMLPCNIIVQEQSPNTIEVSSINPMTSMQSVKNDALMDIAKEVSNRLETVINNLKNEK